MKFITPMYKNAAIFALVSCAAIISASAQTTPPYAGDVYWTQQKNDDTSGDTKKWGISINNDTLYSPGDGTSVGEAFKEGEIDWANSNIFIDARFTGTDSNGVNHVSGINPDHLGDDKTFTVKNFTIADNWDESLQSNKHSYWWDGNNADDNVTLKIKENFNIYSAINGGGKNIHLDVPTINIDISEKMPSNPEKNRGYSNVNLEWLLSLNADTVNINDANYVNFSNGKNLNIKEINVSKLGDQLYFNGTKGLRIDTLNMYTEDQTNSKIHGFRLDGASDAVINNVNVTGMSSDFAANNSTDITFGDIHLTDSHWLVFQGSTNVTTGSIYLTRTNGFTGVETEFDYMTGKLKIVSERAYSKGERAAVRCYGADDVREGVAIMWQEGVDIAITGNSTNPTRFQHPVMATYKKERIEKGMPFFSVASGGGTGRTLHPDNMAAGPASYGMTDTMGRMHSDAQFAGSSSVPAHVEMMGLIGMGNNPMVGASVDVAVAVAQAMK